MQKQCDNSLASKKIRTGSSRLWRDLQAFVLKVLRSFPYVKYNLKQEEIHDLV